MTTADESLPPVVSGTQVAAPLARQGFWERFDRWSASAGERLNPILVKETRQALKSKQFLITFALVLICGWAWSILGIALSEASRGAREAGGEMFFGYFVILSFPLLVIVPFSAYRSLASEWEDNTYELLSISALKPHQIVSGKLGSSLLQIALYLSAIAPCLAFTYLLRGIDLPTMLFLLFWLVVNAISSTLLALCAATISRAKHWQVIMSVVLVAGCLLNFSSFGIALAGEMLFSPFRMLYFDQGGFWAVCGMILTAAIGYDVMFFLIARAALMFSSENRSTGLRICMVVQYLLFMGWAFWFWLFLYPSHEFLAVFAMLVGIHWWVMGMFLIGERPELSQRAKRNLPQSFVGRMFWISFNPGSGTGYLFVLGNLASAMVVLLAAPAVFSAVEPILGTRVANFDAVNFTQLVTFCGLGLCYMAIYLGLTRLILLALRPYTQVTLMLAVLIHVMLVLAGTLVPLTIQLSLNSYRTGYSLLQVSNFFWTLEEIIGRQGIPAGDLTVVLTAVPLLAALVVLFNLPSVGRELRQQRVAAPQRVQQEEQLLHPAPEPPRYVSPWDEPPQADTMRR